MSRTNNNSVAGQVVKLAVAIVFGALALWVYLNQQFVFDKVSAWQYQPTSEVQALVGRAGVNDKGRFLMYASHTSIDDAQKFNQECNRIEQNAATLGCYSANQIYVYNITDPRLDGIKEVTAAHEMLHAAYQRLSASERNRVDRLVEAEYAKLKDNQDFATRMAIYAKAEPTERDNELHSIIGTEVADINPELETYYTSYFSDRHKVTTLHDQYQAVFDQLSAQSVTLSARLNTLADKIDTESATYNTTAKQLNTDIASFNDRAASGGFSSQQEFNTARSALVKRANQLSAQRIAINEDIVAYQELYKQLQSVASQSDALNRSIDSSLAPAPQI
jgi:hypothetical protein